MKPVLLRFETQAAPLTRRLAGREPGWQALVAGAGLAFCLAFAVGMCWQLAQWHQESAALRDELLAHGRLAQPTDTRTPALSPEQRRAWRQVTRQLNTPWSELLTVLETHTPADVALVFIEPDARLATVRLQAEAKTLDVLLAYAQGLRGAGPFLEVLPVKHETNEQDANQPIRLSLHIRLRDRRPGPWGEGQAP